MRTKQPHEANRGHNFTADGGALFPETFETTKEVRAPRAGSKQAAKQDDCVDADAALARPVGLRVEVEPKRKLVKGEGSADTVADGHQAAEKDGEWRVLAAQVKQPSIADDEEDEDSPDKMMDVASANHDPVEWADVVGDEADEDSHAKKSDQKGERRDEKTPARAVRDGGPNQKADARKVQEEQKGGDNNGGKEKKNQRAGTDIHLSIETLREGQLKGKSSAEIKAR